MEENILRFLISYILRLFRTKVILAVLNSSLKLHQDHMPCIMFFNRETRQIALFNKTSGDLITAEKFRQNYFNKCVDSGQIGKATN